MRRLLLVLGILSLAGPFGIARASIDPGSCGWTVRSDPVAVNVLYPDKDAVYFIAALPVPPAGGYYRVSGDFPHARYMSFVTYNGLPVDALLDRNIVPDAGSTNPFVPGADRTATSRRYTVQVVPDGSGPNTVRMGPGQLDSPTAVGYLYYRIYVPDDGAGPRGGVELPTIQLVTGPEAGNAIVDCEGARDALPDGTPAQDAVAQTSTPALPASYLRASDPPSWSVASGLTASALKPIGQENLVTGGPGSNPDNNYIVANISRSLGEVLVIHTRAPTTPATRDGDPIMGDGDLRYWSWCQNSRSTRYIDCISDEDLTIDEDGTFTIVISSADHRPANAINWLPWGPEPDAQLIYRHMLPSDSFLPHAAQGVGDRPIDEAMGAYYPGGTYCSTAAFEAGSCGA